jgi:hypothetical protein
LDAASDGNRKHTTALLLIVVAASLVGLAVEAMLRFDRASRIAGPSVVSVPHRWAHRVHAAERSGVFASPVLFVLSAVLVLLVIAAVV